MDIRNRDRPVELSALRALYVASLGGDGQPMAPAMALALQANFGSVERWRSEFITLGQSLGNGSGWVLLVFQPRDGTLVNRCGVDPAPALAGGVPLLALDMLEHSTRIDVGAEPGARVDAFVSHIHWAAVYERYQSAVHGASEACGAGHDDLSAALVVDVRRAGMFEKAQTRIPGARWRDPAAVGTWASELPTDRAVIVYCIYGHEVGRATALRLRAQGIKARYLLGGIDGWQAAGRPLEPKEVLS